MIRYRQLVAQVLIGLRVDPWTYNSCWTTEMEFDKRSTLGFSYASAVGPIHVS